MTYEPTSDAVGTLYDQQTDLLSAALGGSIHMGYWDDPTKAQDMGSATDRMTTQVADRLAIAPGQHLLDVGCGSGKPALLIATNFDVHITGITISKYQIELAEVLLASKTMTRTVKFQIADATKPLPITEASFDGAYAIESLAHISDKSAALAQIARALRPGSRLVIADLFHDENGGGADPQALERVAKTFELPRFPTVNEYRHLLQGAGFTVAEFVDIRDHVRPAIKSVADAVHQQADTIGGEAGEQLHGAAADLAQLEKLGYALVTATRE